MPNQCLIQLKLEETRQKSRGRKNDNSNTNSLREKECIYCLSHCSRPKSVYTNQKLKLMLLKETNQFG